MRKRIWLKTGLFIILLLTTLVLSTDYWVSHSTNKQLFSDVQMIPKNKVGLVLGTSKYLAHGVMNPYYQFRINAAIALFQAGKIDYILVSGDNGTEHYNEPEMMKKDLVANGVPPEKVYTDYAGFRTLDSVLRCREVFGEDHITIISQPFHNERALFIANKRGITAVAYNARDIDGENGFKVQFREKFARVKMLLDLLFYKQPKYFGPRILIQ